MTKKSEKQKLQDELEFTKRVHFLEKWSGFNEWLFSVGFRNNHYWKEPCFIHYSWFNTLIDNGPNSTERYNHDKLETRIDFIRSHNQHVVLDLWDMKLKFMNDYKQEIIERLRKIKNEKILILSSVEI